MNAFMYWIPYISKNTNWLILNEYQTYSTFILNGRYIKKIKQSKAIIKILCFDHVTHFGKYFSTIAIYISKITDGWLKNEEEKNMISACRRRFRKCGVSKPCEMKRERTSSWKRFRSDGNARRFLSFFFINILNLH